MAAGGASTPREVPQAKEGGALDLGAPIVELLLLERTGVLDAQTIADAASEFATAAAQGLFCAGDEGVVAEATHGEDVVDRHELQQATHGSPSEASKVNTVSTTITTSTADSDDGRASGAGTWARHEERQGWASGSPEICAAISLSRSLPLRVRVETHEVVGTGSCCRLARGA
jgi:hypothetical protein